MSSIEQEPEIKIKEKCNNCPFSMGSENTNDDDQIHFWSENPNVLLHSLEFFPTENMTYAQKMNSISRLIIILAVVGFIFSRNIRLIFVAGLILLGMYLLYTAKRNENEKKGGKKMEMFNGNENIPSQIVKGVYDEMKEFPPTQRQVFDTPSANNPMSNVLISDYDYNPYKKPAPPSFNKNVGSNILSQAKQMVVDANPGQPDIADKLFRNLGDEFIFEQSMRPFVSNPSTTIPNDQQAFADFCYGSMISSKEGNMFSLARNLARHQT
jgi:hypothetical protein